MKRARQILIHRAMTLSESRLPAGWFYVSSFKNLNFRHIKTKTYLSLLLIISISLNGFTQIDFGPQQALTTNADEARDVYACDIDGDGDMDVISASLMDGKIAWYENTDGAGTFGIQHIITTDGANSVYTCDIDGDGDMDVLSAGLNDKIVWYQNTDGAGTFGTEQIITTNVVVPESVYASDIDGDGDLDVLSASQLDDKIAWYENTDGTGTFGPQQVITTNAIGAKSVYACDIDGDGDMDVLSASYADSKIAWYENTDGNGSFGTQQVITTAVNVANSVYSADLDGDGDMDVLSASYEDDKIAWYENDGAGTFSSQQIITTDAISASDVYACDIDSDGDMDVLSSSIEDDKIAWYENTDGSGTFGIQQIITTNADGALSVYACDIDGDSDMDVLSASYADSKIAWYENTDGNGTFGAQQVITHPADGATSVYSADLDGDGDMDVLSASSEDDKIAWYENTDGNGTFGTQKVITTAADSARSVYSADLDGDGDMDVLSASWGDDKIAWYENTNGAGTFSSQQIITTDAIGARDVYACDIDSDGDMDVLSASYEDDKIAWYENDGEGTFSSQQIITTNADGASSVYTCDIDGDSDMDVLSASSVDDKMAWYQNIDGAGTFGTQQIITTYANHATSVYANDIDSDGDMDVLSASWGDHKIAWYENTDGAGTFSSQQIITTDAMGASDVYACDTGGDGGLDVLSASWMDDKIAWYENTDGAGTFGTQQVITTDADGALSVYACDIDSDGDIDVLSASYEDDKIAWYENLGPLAFSDKKLESFTIYPNPATGNLRINSKTKIIQIEIYNQFGQLVLSNIDKKTIDISTISQGLYFCKIKDKYGNTGTRKVVKE